MSSSRGRTVGLMGTGAAAVAALLGGPFPDAVARAQEPPPPPPEETRQLAAEVDFSRPPNQVEGYNKVRFTCELTPGGAEAGRSFRIRGQAYYPDGVVLVLALRYWKHTQPLARIRVTVAGRAFETTAGPFPRAFPGGKVVVEAWFLVANQPPEVARRLADERYFSCTPPCRWDRRNATRVEVDFGGDAAQRQDERAEKEQIGRAVEAVSQAFQVCAQACLEARGDATPARAAAALTRLRADLDAGRAGLTGWSDTRQFLLFPARVGEVDVLASLAWEAGRLHAAAAGAPVEGVSGGRQEAFTELTRALRAYQDAHDALRGFLAEEGSLDREWQRQNDAARGRWDDARARDGQQQGSAPDGTAPPGGRR